MAPGNGKKHLFQLSRKLWDNFGRLCRRLWHIFILQLCRSLWHNCKILSIKEIEFLAVIDVADGEPRRIRYLTLQVGGEVFDDTLAPTFFDMHLFNIPAQFPIELQHLPVHLDGGLYLAPAVASAEALHPLGVVLIDDGQSFAHCSSLICLFSCCS